MHLGFGFGIVFINPALEAVGWDPPRFTTTAFQNAWVNPIMWNAFMGWIGVDQYDEANPIGQDFLDRYAKRYDGRRPEYCVPSVNHDVAATLVRAFSDAHPLSPAWGQRGVGAGQDDARRRRRTRDPSVVRQVDSPRLDGCRLPGGSHPGRRWRQLAPRRPLRSKKGEEEMSTDQSTPLAAGKRFGTRRRDKNVAGAAGSPVPRWPPSRCSSSRTAGWPSTRASPTRTCTAGRGR